MDRNVVIGTVLIAVIMFVWLWMLGPQAPQQAPTMQEEPVVDTQAVQQREMPFEDEADEAAPDETEERAAGPADAPAGDTTFAAARQGEEQFVTVRTDLYEARFSTKGASPVSFVLAEYERFDQETPVQLIAPDRGGALGLVFTSPSSHLVDTRALYFDSPHAGDTLVVTEAPLEVTFEARLGGGAIRQTYVFQPDEYEVGLRVEQPGAASFATEEGYELVWDGGIPFTEGDPEKEAQGAGAYARSGGEVESITLDSDAYQEERLAGEVSWTAVKSKYFTAVVIPDGPTRGAELIGELAGERGTPLMWEDYTTRLQLPSPGAEADAFRLYLGPMEFFRITDYGLGLYDMVDYGYDIFEWITRPLAKYVFIPTFTFLSSFIPNYGIVIILFAILIKLLVYPLTKKSYESMARMRELQPKMDAIKEKYGDNPQKQQEAMMKMYKETGVNPLGGCLPMLLQYPIIIALWMYLPQSLEIRQQGFLWAHDLSAPDVILQLPFTIPFYGDFVGGFTLLMGISMVVQMRIQMNPSTNPQAKIFTYVFPVMIFVIFNRLAAGLSLYYLVYNVVTAVQQKWINHQIEKKKDEPATNGRGGRKDAAKAGRGAGRKSGKKVRSKN